MSAMSSLITINASKARNEFFELLGKVYFENKSFLIKKAGIPFAELIKPREKKRGDIMSLAGVWKNVDTDSMIKYIYKGRKDRGEIKRKLPSFK